MMGFYLPALLQENSRYVMIGTVKRRIWGEIV
jgi:hypothetical protein